VQTSAIADSDRLAFCHAIAIAVIDPNGFTICSTHFHTFLNSNG
jgi:hypothetical protein